MNILHVANAYPTQKTPEYGIFVKEQIESLKNHGVNSKIYHINARELGKREYFKAVIHLGKIGGNFDIIHCHHLYSALSYRLSLANTPFVVSLQNDIDHELERIPLQSLRRGLAEIILERAELIISKSGLHTGIAQNKTETIPNGINLKEFVPEKKEAARNFLGLKNESTYLLFVSSKSLSRRQKRLDRFNEVVRLLQENNNKIEPLYLTGQPREVAKKYFAAADVHLLTSDFEGSPNSAKEAIAMGTPVVTTPVGDTAKILDGVPACFRARSFDTFSLALLVERSLLYKPDAEKMRKRLKLNGYDSEHVSLRLFESYKRILGD